MMWVVTFLSIFLILSPATGDEARTGGYKVPGTPFQRDLVSISLADVVAAGLDTGIYKGSPKVLANKKSYDAAFYDTLASVHQLFVTLSGNQDLARFEFLLRWRDLFGRALVVNICRPNEIEPQPRKHKENPAVLFRLEQVGL